MKYLISILFLFSIETLACNKEEAFKKLDNDSVGYAKAYQCIAKAQNLRIETPDRYIEVYDFWVSGSIIKKLGTMSLSVTKDCQYYSTDFVPVE